MGARHVGALGSLLCATSVYAAEETQDWSDLFEARLMDMADADSETASLTLTTLLERLDEGDALYGQPAYWLAHAHLGRGDIQAANQALELAMQAAGTREAAVALQAQMEALKRTIVSIPLRHPLDDDPGPFVHSWLHGDQGWLDMARPQPDSSPALRWTSHIQDRKDDQISAKFGQAAHPVHGVRISLRAEAFPAYLRVLLVDERDREFATDPLAVPTDRWLDLDLPLGTFHSTDPTTPREKPRSALDALHVHDVTAYLSADRGEQVIWLDDLEIW